MIKRNIKTATKVKVMKSMELEMFQYGAGMDFKEIGQKQSRSF